MKKQILSLLLSLCLLAGMVPAAAADPTADTESGSGNTAASSYIPGPGDITFSPASVNLGSVVKDSEDTGNALPSQTVTVTNTSEKTMYICVSPPPV